MIERPRFLKVTLPGEPAKGLGGLVVDFGQVTVILGANGCGKSRRLQNLHNIHGSFQNRPIVYVEGGRTIEVPDGFEPDPRNRAYRTLTQIRDTHKSKATAKLTSRVRDTLVLLFRQGQAAKIQHSDAVRTHSQSGGKSDPPQAPEPPLERLFTLFNQVFPDIKLDFDGESEKFYCEKHGSRYSPKELSDGEKQSLCLLADIALLSDPEGLVIADEPELNLNPLLACRLWDTIEAERPNAAFIYATHCLSFMLRDNVDCRIILSSDGRSVITLENDQGITSAELRPFLGAVPSILLSSDAIVVEGEPTSFDSVFYQWVISAPKTAVIALGSSSNVYAASNHLGVWERVAPMTMIRGVIDRDFRSNAHITSLSSVLRHI